MILFEVQPLVAYELMRLAPRGTLAPLELAARIDPAQPAIPLAQARLLALRDAPLDAASFALADGRLRESLRLDRGSERAPRAIADLHQRAAREGLFEARGATKVALRSIDRAVEAAPRDCFLRADRARLLALLGRYREALAPAEAALSLEPNFLRARLDLAGFLLALGRSDEALAAIEDAEDRVGSLSGIRVPSTYGYQLLVWEPERASALRRQAERGP